MVDGCDPEVLQGTGFTLLPNVRGAGYVPLFLDAQWIDGWPNPTNGPLAYYDQQWQAGSNMGRFCVNRHNEMINGAFLDFSVRKIGLNKLWTLNWHRKYDTASPWTIAGGAQPEDLPQWMRGFKRLLKINTPSRSPCRLQK